MSFRLLSIITPVYRDAEALERTCRSLAQLMDGALPWEHVIIDSSPELTQKVREALPASWPLVHLVRDPAGVSAAQNEGVYGASGEIIWFLNAGDTLHSREALERACARFSGGPLLVCSSARLFRAGKYLYSVSAPETLWDGVRGKNRICHQALLYAREVFRKVGAFDLSYRLAADYDHHLRCALAHIPYEVEKGALVDYDMGGLSSNVESVFAEFRAVHRKHADALGAAGSAGFSFLRFWEWNRIRLFRRLAQSPIGSALRSIWYALKRGLHGN